MIRFKVIGLTALVAAWLAGCGGGGDGASSASAEPPLPPPSAPTRLSPQEAKTLALSLWRDDDRTVHPKGSCAGCHGPDFIDLAVTGSTDADIKRRALLDGATEEESDALVLAVGDMRSGLGIQTENAREFRPFQPGGAQLLPDNADPDHVAAVKRDIAFGEQLERLLPTLFGTPVDTLETARAAQAEMLDLLQGTNASGHNPRGLDLRSLPVGLLYPRWSADLHHGAEDGTFNDWIADIAHDAKPDRREDWIALMDAYLAQPDTENFWRLYAAAETDTEAQLLSDCTFAANNAHLACAGAEDFNRNKFQSALIGQHMLRESVQAHASTFARGPLAFSYVQEDPRLDFMLDRRKVEHLPAPSWEVGDRARVMLDNSNEDGSLRRLLAELGFPDFAQDSIDAARTAKEEQQSLRLSWFWIGFTQDPSFARIHASNSTKSGEYMIASLLEENLHLHNSFAANMRIMAKGTLPDANVRRVNNQRRPQAVDPVFRLNYSYFVGYNRETLRWKEDRKAGRTVPQELKDRQAELWTRFTGNAFRMAMHLYLDNIDGGAEATDVPLDPLRNHFATYHGANEAADTALLDRVDAVRPPQD